MDMEKISRVSESLRVYADMLDDNRVSMYTSSAMWDAIDVIQMLMIENNKLKRGLDNE